MTTLWHLIVNKTNKQKQTNKTKKLMDFMQIKQSFLMAYTDKQNVWNVEQQL